MSYELWGENFDNHGSGNDLMFPHHENEIAQSCCAHGHDHDGGGFANYWLHNEMLQVEGKKMSKSLGNFFTVRDLLDGHDGMAGVPGEVIRFVFLSTHYRKPMDWTAEKAEQAKATLKKWRKMTEGVEAGEVLPSFRTILGDDLNTAGAITELYRLERMASRQEQGPNEPVDMYKGLLSTFLACAQLLGLLTDELGDWDCENVDLKFYADHLSALRTTAMETKDFSAVDAMKTALFTAGVEVRMSKTGIELEPGPNFDPAKLEGLL